MKKLVLLFLLSLSSVAANAAEYKCFASKYPSDMTHFFTSGYVILNVNPESVNLKYYYVNSVARQTTLSIDATYELNGVQGGRGQMKDMIVGSLDQNSHNFPGDTIDTMYFDQSLISNADSEASGIVGQFAFPGHGYSYDRNICYNVK